MKPVANEDIRWRGIDILHWEENGYHFVSVGKGKQSAPLEAALREGCWQSGDLISDGVIKLLEEIEKSYCEADLY